MKTKHTEGEAKAVEWCIHAPTTIEVGDCVIAECSGHGNDTDLDIANAERLALAWNMLPEMIAALASCESRLAIKCEATCMFQEDLSAIEAARAILAKATKGE